MPIKARGVDDRDHEPRIVEGIRLAADHGAVAVCSSMGPLQHSPELLAAVEYAESRGTIFVDVHPEYVLDESGQKRQIRWDERSPLILHPGPVSVPDHPVSTETDRDVHTWPYDLDAEGAVRAAREACSRNP